MGTSPKFARKTRKQDGFALILVVFLTTLLLISVMAIAPSIRTEKQREKEQEMIWRGKQYVRGIKLYYRKNGPLPNQH
jgi:type II secretory pathway component PulK